MKIELPFLKEAVGAGDLVKAATSALGVKPCSPCEERARRMNAALSFAPRPQWNYPEVPEGWTRTESCGDDIAGAALFTGPGGKFIVWSIKNGAYSGAHSYCCGQLQAKALEEWKSRCR